MEDETNRQNVVKKRKNEATSERLKKRKTQQAAVVVQGINAVLKDYPRFVEKIQAAVKTVSELAVITSWALNHHILYYSIVQMAAIEHGTEMSMLLSI